MTQEANLFQSAALVIALIFLLPSSVGAQIPHTSAQINYILQCQGCHGADGGGIGQSIPDLVADGKSFLQSTEGRKYFVSVPGSANSPLSDEELTDVINYIIESIIIKNGDAESLLYKLSEVSTYRQIKMLKDPTELRREIIDSCDYDCN